ncbi:hypothetical protein TYRP_022544 [Tyrophagus putrescentiae]|nr:hypothetical protein TYRP_022544 [Tyrophagus putrescentiae]
MVKQPNSSCSQVMLKMSARLNDNRSEAMRCCVSARANFRVVALVRNNLTLNRQQFTSGKRRFDFEFNRPMKPIARKRRKAMLKPRKEEMARRIGLVERENTR